MEVLRSRRGGLAVLFSTLIAACSGSSGTSDSPPDPTEPVGPAALQISGSVGDGPVVGATLRITDADGTLLDEHVSSDLADYQLDLPGDTALPVLLSATGGTDLVTGRELDFTLLGAALQTGSFTVNLSPLTTLAVRAAECSPAGLTAEGLELAWSRIHAELSMGLDADRVADPMGEPVDRDNIEPVVLANEALGEAVRRTELALSSAGNATGGDDILRQLGCDLVDRDAEAPPVEAQVIAAFKAAELGVRLETLAGRLEVDGRSATDRMNDAIRTVMRDFANPTVLRVALNEAARAQTLALVSLFQDRADNDALVALAGALRDASPGTAAARLNAALGTGLQNDLHAMATNVAFADPVDLDALEERRAKQRSAPRPFVSLAADVDEVAAGDAVSLSWASSDAERCVSSWNGAVATEGVTRSGPLQAGTVFELTCTGLGGTVTDSATVLVEGKPPPVPEPEPEPEPEPGPDPVLPTLTLTAGDTTVVSGDFTTLTWNAANADGCLATGGWIGARAVSASQRVGPITDSVTYRLTCSGEGGSVTRGVTVEAQAKSQPVPAPTVSLSAGAAEVRSGESVQLTWTSTGADSCEASGGWSGARSRSGSRTVGPLSSDATFRLTCTGDGGTRADSVSVQVQAAEEPPAEELPTPSVRLTVSDSPVASGSHVTLEWSSTDATSCAASGDWSGPKGLSGSQLVGPVHEKSDYILTCRNAEKNDLSNVVVLVNGTVNLEWEPPTENEDGTPLDDLASYRIYYGQRSGQHTEELSQAGDTTSRNLTLPSGEYYFVMTAVDEDGNESRRSNEVMKAVD